MSSDSNNGNDHDDGRHGGRRKRRRDHSPSTSSSRPKYKRKRKSSHRHSENKHYHSTEDDGSDASNKIREKKRCFENSGRHSLGSSEDYNDEKDSPKGRKRKSHKKKTRHKKEKKSHRRRYNDSEVNRDCKRQKATPCDKPGICLHDENLALQASAAAATTTTKPDPYHGNKYKTKDTVKEKTCIDKEDDLQHEHRRQRMIPMSKQDYEQQQSQIRHVFDAASGRMRLVRGTGEIIESIVSRAQHESTNRMATAHDGCFFAGSTMHRANQNQWGQQTQR